MSIRTENLTHIYNKNGPYEKTALDNVSVSFGDGEFVGLIGHTGSGKSTLIQHLNGVIRPSSGTVYLNDVDIFAKSTDIRQIRKKVGLVFQYPEHQLFEETVYKDIIFGLKNYDVPQSEFKDRAYSAAKTVGLPEELLEKSPFDLSGGQKRRVAIAGVIAMMPEVLVLDEPAAGLDPYGRRVILDEIKKLHEERKITVILVSHSMEDIAKYAGRIVVMDNSKIAMDGTPKEVFSDYERLSSMGLDIPVVTKILNRIRSLGYDVPQGIFDVKEAAQIINTIIKGDINA